MKRKKGDSTRKGEGGGGTKLDLKGAPLTTSQLGGQKSDAAGEKRDRKVHGAREKTTGVPRKRRSSEKKKGKTKKKTSLTNRSRKLKKGGRGGSSPEIRSEEEKGSPVSF